MSSSWRQRLDSKGVVVLCLKLEARLWCGIMVGPWTQAGLESQTSYLALKARMLCNQGGALTRATRSSPKDTSQT